MKHLFLVTFDLRGTVPGDSRYKAADSSLSLHGGVFAPAKQTRFLVTNSSAAAIKASLVQQIGSASTILVIPVLALGSRRIVGQKKVREWKALVAELRASGVTIEGL